MPNSIDRSKFGKLLEEPKASATALLVMLIDTFGIELIGWEPETLRMEIEDEWKVKPKQVNMDKINCLVNFLASNTFYKNIDVFMHTCTVLNDSPADFSQFDPPDVYEMCWAIVELSLLNPPEGPEDEFNPEIITYMQLKLEEEGFHRVPKTLSKIVSMPETPHSINDTLDDEAIDSKAWWDKQQEKLSNIDAYVCEKLFSLLSQIVSLPLTSADQKGLESLVQRARKLLEARGQSLIEADQGKPQTQDL